MSERGFTLIELILAIAIVGILLTIALPSYQQYVKKSKRVEVQAHLMALSHQLASYKLINQSFNGMTISQLGGADFPLVQANYTLTLTDAYGVALDQTTAQTSTWLLVATPKLDSTQQGTGRISLMHSGGQCWYENQDDAVAHIVKEEGGALTKPNCPSAWQP